jgi:hypothetical protein
LVLDVNFLIAVVANLLVIGIAWGSLHQRVKALESEMVALKDLPVQVAELRIMLANVSEHLKDLNASIRWMRDPAPPYRPEARRPVTDADEGR